MLAGVKSTRYSALVTQDDDWSARIARLVAREIRRYRESQQPRMSVQRLADRTAELDMAIPRSVLANLESGRRETVSVAEVLALAAALNVSPIELICPVGFDKETEILPGRMLDPLSAVRWFTGELKLDVTEAATTLRWKPNPEPDIAGYRILWRETTAPLWQHARDVGNVTRETLPVSKDDYVFGVQAYDRDGNLSVATYPRPYYPPRPPAK